MSTWSTAVGAAMGAGLGVIGAVTWATARVHPMNFDDADEKARHLTEAAADAAKTKGKYKRLPKYIREMLENLRKSIATEVWDAYDRGRMIGKAQGRSELEQELQQFFRQQSAMADERAKNKGTGGEWAAVARELRAMSVVVERMS